MINHFEDSYIIRWVLEDDDGKRWTETHTDMSLTDFEIVYGNNVYKIVEIRMELMKNE